MLFATRNAFVCDKHGVEEWGVLYASAAVHQANGSSW